MKPSRLLRNLLIGFGSLSAAIAVLLAIIFHATSGLTTAANRLFSELNEGNTKEAAQLFSPLVDDQTLEIDLKAFARRNSLDDFKSTFWSNRSIAANTGTLEGSINLEDGTTIPLAISLQKSGSDWKIFSITEKRSGVISSASLDGVPNERDLLSMTAETTGLFVKSIKKNDFTKLYEASSRKWQNETSPQNIHKVFEPFVEFSQNTQALNYLNSLKSHTPAFTEKPFINEQSQLMIKGQYTIKPPYIFTYIYMFEGLSWKLAGIKVEI